MSVVANGLVGFAAAVVSLSSMPVTAAERVSDAMASSAPGPRLRALTSMLLSTPSSETRTVGQLSSLFAMV